MRLDPVIGPIVPSFGGFLNPGAVAGGGFHGTIAYEDRLLNIVTTWQTLLVRE